MFLYRSHTNCNVRLQQKVTTSYFVAACYVALSKTRPNFVWSIPGSSILGPMIIDLDPSMPSTITVRTNYEHLSLIFPEKLLNERALAKFYWFLNIVNKKACNTAVKVCNQMCILIQCIVSWCTCIGHIITAGYNRHKVSTICLFVSCYGKLFENPTNFVWSIIGLLDLKVNQYLHKHLLRETLRSKWVWNCS